MTRTEKYRITWILSRRSTWMFSSTRKSWSTQLFEDIIQDDHFILYFNAVRHVLLIDIILSILELQCSNSDADIVQQIILFVETIVEDKFLRTIQSRITINRHVSVSIILWGHDLDVTDSSSQYILLFCWKLSSTSCRELLFESLIKILPFCISQSVKWFWSSKIFLSASRDRTLRCNVRYISIVTSCIAAETYIIWSHSCPTTLNWQVYPNINVNKDPFPFRFTERVLERSMIDVEVTFILYQYLYDRLQTFTFHDLRHVDINPSQSFSNTHIFIEKTTQHNARMILRFEY